MINDNTDEQRLKSDMYRYLSQELAEELLKLDDIQVRGENKEFSTMFADIHHYTAWAESLELEELVSLLNEYFASMTEVIFKYKGTIDKYMGDTIMAVFGGPLSLENHACFAVKAAIEMRCQLAEFNARRLAQNQQPIRLGIGINSDRMFSGNIGSSQRMEFTAIGFGVNLASLLGRVTRLYDCDIIISDTTYGSCSAEIWARGLGKVRLKDIKKPVSIYEVVGLRSEPISEQKQRLIELHCKGREYYLNRQFRLAMNEFATILEEIDYKDKAAALHLERCCQYLSQESLPEDWDRAWDFKEE